MDDKGIIGMILDKFIIYDSIIGKGEYIYGLDDFIKNGSRYYVRINISGNFEYMDDGIYVSDEFLLNRTRELFLNNDILERNKIKLIIDNRVVNKEKIILSMDDIENMVKEINKNDYYYTLYVNANTLYMENGDLSGQINYGEWIIKRLVE